MDDRRASPSEAAWWLVWAGYLRFLEARYEESLDFLRRACHVAESNGKVGTLGISYDGFEPLMALVNPHPALKVSVPMNPMVDGWMGDDWFHNGAFRQQNAMVSRSST